MRREQAEAIAAGIALLAAVALIVTAIACTIDTLT